MNKDFKKIVILGIISIIISSLWIYSLRDIKFTNTKKIQKQIEKQEQKKLDDEYNKLLNEYNNLVDTYTPTITDKDEENDIQTTGYITLLIPWFFENEWFSILTDKLAQKNIILTIEKIDSITEYKKTLSSNLEKYDIALVPSNIIKKLDVENINLWENIKPYFIDLFNENLTSSWNKEIPFAIDPAVTIYKAWISTQNTRNKLFSYALLRNIQKKYAFPIIRWYDDMIENMLSNDIEPFENYLDLLHLHQRQTEENGISEQDDMENTNNIANKSKYSYINQMNIINILKNQNKYCEIFPSTCIMLYWYADIKFWFLTDFDIINKYFWNNNLSIGDFTDTQYSYPVKWRSFIVPKWNEKTNITKEFFNKYISESLDWTEFWNYSLSAISNYYDTQKLESKFNSIIKNEAKFFIFQ